VYERRAVKCLPALLTQRTRALIDEYSPTIGSPSPAVRRDVNCLTIF
jgi:hypothetical protein